MDTLDEQTLRNAIKSLEESGAREPLHLYASSEHSKTILEKEYPGIVVHLVPQAYLPTNTQALLSQVDYS